MKLVETDLDTLLILSAGAEHMNSKQIEQAAQLLEKRQKMYALRSLLLKKPSLKMGLYAADGEDTMYEDIRIGNEDGRILLNVALSANSDALTYLGVEEFVGHPSTPEGIETP